MERNKGELKSPPVLKFKRVAFESNEGKLESPAAKANEGKLVESNDAKLEPPAVEANEGDLKPAAVKSNEGDKSAAVEATTATDLKSPTNPKRSSPTNVADVDLFNAEEPVSSVTKRPIPKENTQNPSKKSKKNGEVKSLPASAPVGDVFAVLMSGRNKAKTKSTSKSSRDKSKDKSSSKGNIEKFFQKK